MYCVQQETVYDQISQLQREFQLDVAEPVTYVARVTARAFTDSLD